MSKRIKSLAIQGRKVMFEYQGTIHCLEYRNKKKLKAHLRWKLGMDEKEVNEILDFVTSAGGQAR